jgi:hypothetical protein
MEQVKRLVTKRIKSFLLLEDEEPRSFQTEFQASVKVSQRVDVLRRSRGPVSTLHWITHIEESNGLVRDCHSRSLELSTGVSHNRKLLCHLPYMISFGTLRKSSIITRLLSVIQQSTIILSRRTPSASATLSVTLQLAWSGFVIR